MTSIRLGPTDLETALQFRMTLSVPPRAREAALSAGDTSPDAVHIGAYVDGKVVGVCSFGPEPLPVLDRPEAWRCRGLMVLPEFRARGVGGILFHHLLRQVRRRPHPLAWSYVKPTLASMYSGLDYGPTGFMHSHPIAGKTLLFGNKHTLDFIRHRLGDGHAEVGELEVLRETELSTRGVNACQT